MTEETAALLITAYANGLRRELELLGAAETTDLVSEVVSMLRDASHGDPEVAAAEIESLGPPEELARTILEQRGLPVGPGTPAASWWRLGLAAPIDILIGLAPPLVAAFFALAVVSLPAPAPGGETIARVLLAVLAMASVAFTGAMSWNYWKPWREGGTLPTVGMTLAGISVIRVGGTRTVALTSDLMAAGLAHGKRSRLGALITVALVVFLVAWAGSVAVQNIGTGLPDPTALVGDASVQQQQVRDSLTGFYAPILDPGMHDEMWPGAWIDPSGIGGEPLTAVVERLRTPQLRSYTIGSMTSPTPGVWEVTVSEQRGASRTVLVTMGLRMDWAPEDLRTSWTVIGYEVR